jgi:Leucine-rich repeat (LRR) protein
LLQLFSLTHLSLHDCGLSSCSGLLGRLPALHSLVLSFNQLTGLEDLLPHGCSVCQLTSLDVCHNHISSWQSRWLAGCCQLAVLDVSHNSLADIGHLQQLTRCERTMHLVMLHSI